MHGAYGIVLHNYCASCSYTYNVSNVCMQAMWVQFCTIFCSLHAKICNNFVACKCAFIKLLGANARMQTAKNGAKYQTFGCKIRQTLLACIDALCVYQQVRIHATLGCNHHCIHHKIMLLNRFWFVVVVTFVCGILSRMQLRHSFVCTKSLISACLHSNCTKRCKISN